MTCCFSIPPGKADQRRKGDAEEEEERKWEEKRGGRWRGREIICRRGAEKIEGGKRMRERRRESLRKNTIKKKGDEKEG